MIPSTPELQAALKQRWEARKAAQKNARRRLVYRLRCAMCQYDGTLIKIRVGAQAVLVCLETEDCARRQDHNAKIEKAKADAQALEAKP